MPNKSTYSQNISGCLDTSIGSFGLSQTLLKHWLEKTETAVHRLREEYANGSLPLLNICSETEDINTAEKALKNLEDGAETIIFFGTGGSSLGGQTLAQIGGWNIPYDKHCLSPGDPRIRFIDNLDSRSLASLLSNVNFLTTRFVVISKSGTTIETLAQTIATLTATKNAGHEKNIPKFFLGITEPSTPRTKNNLRTLLEEHSIKILDHPIGIGGRFSCLSNVGLVPAMIRGLDPFKLRAGAYSVLEPVLQNTLVDEIPFSLGAACMVALSKERNVRNMVMMPYSDRLAKFSEWFVQLWSESLGKKGFGSYPLPALGPVDQHSQLQLFMDGPHDTAITIIRVECQKMGPKLEEHLAQVALIPFMGGKTVGDIVHAQGQAVASALMRAKKPVRTIDIPKLDEYSAGALLMHFMLETIIAGYLLELNPFDQPGVELSKTLTKQILAQAG